MKIRTLINKAAKCKTDQDVAELLSIMQDKIGNSRFLSNLVEANSEAYMEDGGSSASVRFDLNYGLSDDYIILVRPEIRYGEFCIYVATNLMIDGRGFGSQNWKEIDSSVNELKFDLDSTVSSACKRAKEVAIENHLALLDSVGVPGKLAATIAKNSW